MERKGQKEVGEGKTEIQRQTFIKLIIQFP